MADGQKMRGTISSNSQTGCVEPDVKVVRVDSCDGNLSFSEDRRISKRSRTNDSDESY